MEKFATKVRRKQPIGFHGNFIMGQYHMAYGYSIGVILGNA